MRLSTFDMIHFIKRFCEDLNFPLERDGLSKLSDIIQKPVVQVERVPSAVVTETAEFGVFTASWA